MAQGVDLEQEVLDPSPSNGLDPRAGDEEPHNETTPLIGPPVDCTSYGTPQKIQSAEAQTSDESHYRNVDKKHFWWLFGGILFGDLIAFFDSTLMASSHPVITSYFNASNSASWLSTVFFLTSTMFQPLAGRISDTVGRRPVYLFSITIFFLTTLWCALAQSIGSFICARAMCGLGAGGVITMSFVIISDIVKLEYRGLYQSYLNMFYGLGHCLGASLGGLLCDRLGWRWAFGIQLPCILLYLVLAIFTTPSDLGPNLMKTEGKTVVEAFKTFDILGSIALAMAVAGLILGLNLGGNICRWSHPAVILSLVLFVVASAFLILIERRAKRPILPLNVLSTRPLANLMISNFFASIVTQTVLFNAPLFFQAVQQMSPTASGLFLISPLIGVTSTSVFTGFFITWSRRMKLPMGVGVTLLLLGASATTCLSPGLPGWASLLLIPGASTGQGFFFPATSIAVLALSAQEDQAVVTTTLGLMRNLGTVMGVAISSWVLQNALIMTLDRIVTGADKPNIILMVRKSVKAIKVLDPVHKAQVIRAYADALRVTFGSGIVFAIIVVFLIIPMRLPRLQKRN